MTGVKNVCRSGEQGGEKQGSAGYGKWHCPVFALLSQGMTGRENRQEIRLL